MKLQDPKPSYVEGQAPPNDNCAANMNCPQHKMCDHLQKDKSNKTLPNVANDSDQAAEVGAKNPQPNKKRVRYDDAVRDKATDLAQTRVLDDIIGSTYNE